MSKTYDHAVEDPETHDLCKIAFVMAIKDALNVVSGKWKLAIVCTLLSGPKGFAEIERLLGGISPRMLSRDLRELEVNGVVAREGNPDSSLRNLKYALTLSGHGLEEIITTFATWGQNHRALNRGSRGRVQVMDNAGATDVSGI